MSLTIPHIMKPSEWTRDGMNVLVRCPKCKKMSSICDASGGHTIMANGIVSPSVECPREPCDWHTFILLEGWVP